MSHFFLNEIFQLSFWRRGQDARIMECPSKSFYGAKGFLRDGLHKEEMIEMNKR